jgi:hypothetical protein
MPTSAALEVITRGYDSSGRVLAGTRQYWQHFDRVNDAVGGMLVPVQGAFRARYGGGAADSADTHDEAGCGDVRVWNLTGDQLYTACRAGRDPQLVGGAAWFPRTTAQGFDPHIHWLLLGDSPMSTGTAWQASEYGAGRNGLASRGRDDFWRPPVITDYVYLEDDMTPDEHAELFRIGRALDDLKADEKQHAKGERDRDAAERDRDKNRFTRLVTALGQSVDQLGILINSTDDAATKDELRKLKRQLMRQLKDDPDVTGVDNPSDDAMEQAGA